MRLPKIILEGDGRLLGFETPRSALGGPVPVVGWREWAGLPALGIAWVEAKIDTGARTSALHVNSVEAFEAGGRAAVRFDVIGEAESVPWHEAPVADRRWVRSSNGEAELRFVIRTELALASRVWPIDLTLTNRERMELPMLVGREALAGRALVDAEKSWLWGKPVWRDTRVSAKPMRHKRLSGGPGDPR